MEAKRICPYCMGELENRVSVCPHCGGVLAGRNPAGSLPVGTLLAGRYTVGEMQSIDGEGILYLSLIHIWSIFPGTRRRNSTAAGSASTLRFRHGGRRQPPTPCCPC